MSEYKAKGAESTFFVAPLHPRILCTIIKTSVVRTAQGRADVPRAFSDCRARLLPGSNRPTAPNSTPSKAKRPVDETRHRSRHDLWPGRREGGQLFSLLYQILKTVAQTNRADVACFKHLANKNSRMTFGKATVQSSTEKSMARNRS